MKCHYFFALCYGVFNCHHSGFVSLCKLLSLTFGIGLFFVLPLVLVGFVDRFITSDLLSNLLEGLVRLCLLLLYLALIGLVPDVRRVFAYHGAEHKTIGAYESGASLDAKGVGAYDTAHVRCGTSFLLIVVVISVLIFAFLGRPPILWRFVTRILLVPLIAAISYEVIRFSADHVGNPLVRAFVLPSMALQGLTTREPDESMLEVAIAALRPVLAADGVTIGGGGEAPVLSTGPDAIDQPGYQTG